MKPNLDKRPKIVSIDPGLEKVALAIWDPADNFSLEYACLTRCEHPVGMERAQKWLEMASCVQAELHERLGSPLDLVVEIPQVYPGVRNEDPNDLIDLAGVLGAIIGALGNVSVEWSPKPREWKGQLPKKVTKQRVDAKLVASEKASILWPIQSLAHNVYDAIHLGIVYLEREGLREFVK